MPRILETVSLFLLLAIVAIRPLVPETYDAAGLSIGPALGPVHNSSPTATLMLDVGILLAAACCFVARALRRERFRVAGIEWGFAVLAIGGVISCVAADQKRLAINATIDWLCMPLMAVVLVQLLRERWQRRLAVAVVLASACVQVAECADQYFLRFDDTWEHYQSIKEEFWTSQGVAADSSKIEQFERRMQAREPQGYLPHSNVTASYLLLCGFAGLGVCVAGFRAMRSTAGLAGAGLIGPGLIGFGLTLLASVAMLATIFLTGSLGGMVAMGAGIALWLLLTVGRRWIALNRRRFFSLVWGGLGLGACATIGHGLYHGDFPNMSMTFRWHYWQTAAKIIADQPITGVGRENFGRHYLAHKPIHAPEEISNPHNLPVQVWSELGIFGLLGVALMLVQTSWTVAMRRDSSTDAEINSRDGPAGRWWMWGAALTAAVVLVRLPLLGVDDANFLYANSVLTVIFWLGGFALFAWSAGTACVGGCGRSGLTRGLSVGIFAFLLHELINFALFVPGTVTTFFALLAVVLADIAAYRKTDTAEPASGTRWLPAAVATGSLAVVGFLVALPVARAESHLDRARLIVRTELGNPSQSDASMDRVRRLCLSAAEMDRLDPVPHAVLASALVKYAPPSVETLRESADMWRAAIELDPRNIGLRNSLARTYQMLAGASGLRADLERSIETAEEALEIYPKSPRGIQQLANALLHAGDTLDSKSMLARAVEEYERALALDDMRPAWGDMPGFIDRELDSIDQNLTAAREIAAALR